MNPRRTIPLPITWSAFTCRKDDWMTYPGNGNEEARGRGDEEDRPNPVDTLQLISQIRVCEI